MGNTYGWTNAALFNLAKCLEIALNEGRCRFSKQQLGPITKNPKFFKSFNEVMEAFRSQVAYSVKHMVIELNTCDIVHGELYPIPFSSLLMNDAIENGKDISRGGARYNFIGPQGIGLADVADSLAVIKKLVFDTQEITMSELVDALENNFEGKELLRNILINKVPKYSSDSDYVDLIARDVAKIYCEEVSKYETPRGGKYRPGLYSVSANVPLGLRVGALPNGRKASAPLADGVSPTHGSDKEGPTATLNSVCKLDHTIATNGTQLNQWLTPSLLDEDKGLQSLVDLIRGFFDQGGFHVQFNVVEKETLIDARKNPQNYKTLLVRVAGYSAYFVELDNKLQDDIIGRTEQLKF